MPRASAQTGYSNRLREILFCAAQAQIGQELKAYYEPPRELPHSMFVLLMQMKDRPTKLAGTHRPTQSDTAGAENSGFNDGPTRSGTS